MSNGAGDATIHPVPRAHATLEMELCGRAPEGVLTSASGARLPFSGWTEFASAIERWREAALVRDPSGSGASAPDPDAGRSASHGKLA
jgi:hypothetical protein